LIQIVLAASIVIVLIMLAATVLPFTYMSAVAFTLIFGFSSGIISMARATLPLVLFGAGGFGTLLGRMMQPFNFAFAASPMIYAYLIQNWGTSSVKWLSLVVVLLSAWAFWSLSRLVDRSHPTDQ
jgi:predicted MFS family arabinose efflux permease